MIISGKVLWNRTMMIDGIKTSKNLIWVERIIRAWLNRTSRKLMTFFHWHGIAFRSNHDNNELLGFWLKKGLFKMEICKCDFFKECLKAHHCFTPATYHCVLPRLESEYLISQNNLYISHIVVVNSLKIAIKAFVLLNFIYSQYPKSTA